jgi:hypothetical protein
MTWNMWTIYVFTLILLQFFLKRLTVEDKILPTPINFKRLEKFLSSMIDSCWSWILKSFNIVSLNFGERGGTKLATLRCYVGSIACGPVLVATFGWQRSPVATLISVAMVFVMWTTPVAIVTGPPCRRPKLATGERCSQLPVATVNLKLLYFLLVKFLLYDMKIYVNNILVQIDTSTTSSYTLAYTNIFIYFISTAYTTTTMHTHKLLDPF